MTTNLKYNVGDVVWMEATADHMRKELYLSVDIGYVGPVKIKELYLSVDIGYVGQVKITDDDCTSIDVIIDDWDYRVKFPWEISGGSEWYVLEKFLKHKIS